MAGNNSIQILRGNNVKTNTTIKNQILLDGQPLYDRVSGLLFVGNGNTIANTGAVNAQWASIASSATVANTRNRLYFNGNGTNVGWNGSSSDTIYVPTSVGSSGQVWGMRSNGTVGWVAQTEIPGTIDHANTANTANTANYAEELVNNLYLSGTYSNGVTHNIAWDGSYSRTIYVPVAAGNSGQVWGMKSSAQAGWIDQEEIPSTIANANYANYAGVAYNVQARDATTSLYICGPSTANTNIVGSANLRLNAYGTITLNAPNYIDINSRGSGGIIRVSGKNMVDISSGSGISIGVANTSIRAIPSGVDLCLPFPDSNTSSIIQISDGNAVSNATLNIMVANNNFGLSYKSHNGAYTNIYSVNNAMPGNRTFYLPNTGGVLATESTSYSTVLNEFANLGIQVDVGPISGIIQSRTGTAQVVGTNYYTAADNNNVYNHYH